VGMLRRRALFTVEGRRYFSSCLSRCYSVSSDSGSDVSHKYSSTLRLPKTSFPNRSSSELISSKLLPQCTDDVYYGNLNNTDRELFILHDGPPYANGELHIGHALNKVLKDIINRFNLIDGKRVFYKPGWDCHGLPIELKALEALRKEQNTRVKILKSQLKKTTNEEERDNIEHEIKQVKRSKLTPSDIRTLARSFALATSEAQSKSFQELGVMGDFKNPYKTLDPSYVINQLYIFKQMMDNGLIRRQEKPVYWSCENATALAEGELEYNDSHNSTAIYLKFPVDTTDLKELSSLGNKVNLLIWTTTPWTIVANKAVSVNSKLDYTILKHQSEYLIVALDLASQVMSSKEGIEDTKIHLSGAQLLKTTYINSLTGGVKQPILDGDHVTNVAGTGLVHTAPGHGNDDYWVCLKNDIAPYSPVDSFGRYTPDVPESCKDLIGLHVLKEGAPKVVEKLTNLGAIFSIQKNYIHSYPYDWRSKKPIIIRSTPQWFINIDQIKERTLKTLQDVKFYPDKGFKRLETFIQRRQEWCISRQRSWGVPIPVIYEKDTGKEILNDEVIGAITKYIEGAGVDSWFDKNCDMSNFLPESMKADSEKYVRGNDTMDVWFDSGTSWHLIEDFLKHNGQDINSRNYLADVYLEGSDQHRGWFQSSLLTKMAICKDKEKTISPYRKIITHGFTLDEKGNKMSKSLGNTLKPQDVINGVKSKNIPALGVDGIRLWVAQSDYFTDVAIGPTILKHVAENLKKIRFTIKFILGNLEGFSMDKSVPYQDLQLLDQYALSKLYSLQQICKESYSEFNFSKVVRNLNHHMNVELSSVYFDLVKDRVYADAPDSASRRSVQTVLVAILQSYISILSPITPIIAQEAWNHAPRYVTNDTKSPFSKGWHELPQSYRRADLELEFSQLFELNSTIKLLMDQGSRVDKSIRNTLETAVYLNCEEGTPVWDLLQKHQSYLSDYFLTSQVFINQELPDFSVSYHYEDKIRLDCGTIDVHVVQSSLHKCPRCWKYEVRPDHELCHRCDKVVN